MFARIQRIHRPFGIVQLRFARHSSTTPRRPSNVEETGQHATDNQGLRNEHEETDDVLDWEDTASTPASAQSSTSELSASNFASILGIDPAQSPQSLSEAEADEPISNVGSSNGLSYTGLPDHKIFLDVPPAQDPLIHYLASLLTHDGRRHTAERRAARVLLNLRTLTRAEPLPIFRRAVERLMPSVRLTRHKHSTKTIEIPIALTEKQQVRYALKWMLDESCLRGGRTVEERLAREIVLVNLGASRALKNKGELHKSAMVNRGNVPAGRARSV